MSPSFLFTFLVLGKTWLRGSQNMMPAADQNPNESSGALTL